MMHACQLEHGLVHRLDAVVVHCAAGTVIGIIYQHVWKSLHHLAHHRTCLMRTFLCNLASPVLGIEPYLIHSLEYVMS